MIKSSKPRKQRLFRYNAPMHTRQHFVHAHVDKALREKMQLKRRAIQLATGDTVKVMSGSKRGTIGKVTRVNLRTGRIFMDSLMKKNAKGKEFNVGVSSGCVYITDLNLSDKVRASRLGLKQEVKRQEKNIQETAAKTTAGTLEKKADGGPAKNEARG